MLGSRVLENYHFAHTQKSLTLLGNKKAHRSGLVVTRLSLANHWEIYAKGFKGLHNMFVCIKYTLVKVLLFIIELI